MADGVLLELKNLGMKAIAFSTGQEFRFPDDEETYEFHSVFFIGNRCFVRYRRRSNPNKLHSREVEGLWDLQHA